MLPDRLVALEQVLSEFLEIVGFMAVHDVHILGEQFERAVLLQLDALARHVGEEEPEIDVEYFPTSM